MQPILPVQSQKGTLHTPLTRNFGKQRTCRYYDQLSDLPNHLYNNNCQKPLRFINILHQHCTAQSNRTEPCLFLPWAQLGLQACSACKVSSAFYQSTFLFCIIFEGPCECKEDRVLGLHRVGRLKPTCTWRAVFSWSHHTNYKNRASHNKFIVRDCSYTHGHTHVGEEAYLFKKKKQTTKGLSALFYVLK